MCSIIYSFLYSNCRCQIALAKIRFRFHYHPPPCQRFDWANQKAKRRLIRKGVEGVNQNIIPSNPICYNYGN